MKKIETLFIEESDIEDRGADRFISSLTKEAFDAVCLAPVVAYKGRIVKNRYGAVDETPNDQVVRPAACGRSEPTPGSAACDKETK